MSDTATLAKPADRRARRRASPRRPRRAVNRLLIWLAVAVVLGVVVYGDLCVWSCSGARRSAPTTPMSGAEVAQVTPLIAGPGRQGAGARDRDR